MELNLLLIEHYLPERFGTLFSPRVARNRSEWAVNYLEEALIDMNFYHAQSSGRHFF